MKITVNKRSIYEKRRRGLQRLNAGSGTAGSGCCCNCCCQPGDRMLVTASWYAHCDFDIAVQAFGDYVGWQCPHPGGLSTQTYLQWHGDVTSCDTGSESVSIDLCKALKDSKWSNHVVIPVYGDFWSGNSSNFSSPGVPYTDFAVDVKVTWKGITKTKFSSPTVISATSLSCPNHQIATITAFDSGTFTLN